MSACVAAGRAAGWPATGQGVDGLPMAPWAGSHWRSGAWAAHGHVAAMENAAAAEVSMGIPIDSNVPDIRISTAERGGDARAAAMIRIEALWRSVEPMDMRAGAERLLARVGPVFGQAQAHDGHHCAHARASRVKPWVHEGFGAW